jgi:CarboxypepD_reg-like domain
MNEEKKNINYSAEDIRHYLDGKLTGPEMQAMEKAALEDPFLADAIEGYEESRKQSVSFESGVADLQKKLAERIHQNRRKSAIPAWFAHWPVAASILFVLGAAWFTITLINKKSLPPKIATTIAKDSGTKKITLQPPTILQKHSTESLLPKSEPTIVHSDSEEIVSDKKTETERKNRDRNMATSRERNIPSTAAEKPVASSANNLSRKYSDTAEKMISSDSMVFQKRKLAAAPELKEALSSKTAGLEISKDKIPSENYVQGIVMNEKGEPVSGATVSLAKSKYGTTTDSNGYFKLFLKNQDSGKKLVFNSVGYLSFSRAVKSDSSFTNRIQLQPSNQSLNEVVVVGYGSEEIDNSNGLYEPRRIRKKSGSVPDSVKNKNVQPVNGWEAFNNTVYKNKNIGTADSLLKGMEVISFIVDEKGQLSSFKIQNSISPTHDATIINLVKETGWKILRGKKQKCIIAVPFE